MPFPYANISTEFEAFLAHHYLHPQLLSHVDNQSSEFEVNVKRYGYSQVDNLIKCFLKLHLDITIISINDQVAYIQAYIFLVQ